MVSLASKHIVSEVVMSESAPYELKVFSGMDGFFKVETIWQQLTVTHNKRFFQHYAWYKSNLFMREADPDQVYFFVFFLHQEPVALIPLIYSSRNLRGLKLRVWDLYFRNDMGLCDLLLLKPQMLQDIMPILIKHLRSKGEPAWDVMEFSGLLASSNAMAGLRKLQSEMTVITDTHLSKYICCESSYEETTKNISTRHKRNLRRKLNKLNKMGEVTYEYVVKQDELPVALNCFLDIEASGWKGDTSTAIKLAPEIRKFYEKLVLNFSKTGDCVIHFLSVDGKKIAAQFCLISDQIVYLLKIGYDENYNSVSPGALLLNQLMSRCSESTDIQAISFITGAAWNDIWAPQAECVYQASVCNKTWKGYAVYFVERVIHLGRPLRGYLSTRSMEKKKT